MRLSTMWQVDRTVGPDGTSPVATALAAPWQPDSAPVFLRSSANFVYTFHREGEPCFLRFAASSEGTSLATVNAELAAMARASARGIPTPQPLRTQDGQTVRVASAGGTTYVAVALRALAGDELEMADLDVERCRGWGSLVARVQTALAEPPLEAGPRDSWPDQVVRLCRQLRSAAPEVRAELAELAVEFGSWSVADGFGLVHLDIELDNIKWIGTQPGLLDFDDCARHWFAVDVASALRDLDNDPVKSEVFLAAYEQAGGAPVRDRLLHARRWVALTSYATIARSLDLAPTHDQPAWLHDLRDRLVARQLAYVAGLARR